MSQLQRRAVGVSLVVAALAVNVPYSALIATFDYPDVLRAPPGEVLTRFHAGGPALIGLWLAFAWVGAPLLYAIPNLTAVAFHARDSTRLKTATMLGIAGLFAQIVGLSRWVFVVPGIARAYVAADEASRPALIAVFEAVHAFGGVLIGEHVGQAFTVGWMALVGLEIVQTRALPRWIGGLGLVAAAVYGLAQAELLATVIPGFPQWEPAGLVGSLLWLGFLLALGIALLRPQAEAAR